MPGARCGSAVAAAGAAVRRPLAGAGGEHAPGPAQPRPACPATWRDGLRRGLRRGAPGGGADRRPRPGAAGRSRPSGRAAIELLAENLSDGVVAPAVLVPDRRPARACSPTRPSTRWTAWSGTGTSATCISAGPAPGSTTSSTSSRPASPAPAVPGRAAPARPHALQDGWRMRRDAPRHRSPNAGWPEAAMAAALGLRLAGPRVYGGRQVDGRLDGRRPGRGQRPPTSSAAIGLAWRAWWLLAAGRGCWRSRPSHRLARQRQQPVEVEAALEMGGERRPARPRPGPRRRALRRAPRADPAQEGVRGSRRLARRPCR